MNKDIANKLFTISKSEIEVTLYTNNGVGKLKFNIDKNISNIESILDLMNPEGTTNKGITLNYPMKNNNNNNFFNVNNYHKKANKTDMEL